MARYIDQDAVFFHKEKGILHWWVDSEKVSKQLHISYSQHDRVYAEMIHFGVQVYHLLAVESVLLVW